MIVNYCDIYSTCEILRVDQFLKSILIYVTHFVPTYVAHQF